MADLNASAIVIAGNATINVAPAGTAMPESLSDELDAAFVVLGYTTEDGVAFSDTKQTGEFRPHQSFYPVRRWIQSRASSVGFGLAQWDADTIPFALGGGEITEPEAGEFRYTPPPPEEIDERAVVIDIADGDRHFRIGIQKGMVSSNVDSTLARTGPALLPITFDALGEDAESPFTIDSDDPAWEPDGS